MYIDWVYVDVSAVHTQVSLETSATQMHSDIPLLLSVYICTIHYCVVLLLQCVTYIRKTGGTRGKIPGSCCWQYFHMVYHNTLWGRKLLVLHTNYVNIFPRALLRRVYLYMYIFPSTLPLCLLNSSFNPCVPDLNLNKSLLPASITPFILYESYLLAKGSIQSLC
jgi:hypothetical protein